MTPPTRGVAAVVPTCLTLLAATVVGLVGHVSGVPGGALVGAMMGAAVVANRRPVHLPRMVGVTGRYLVGLVAGAAITWEALRALGPHLLWGTVASLLTIAAGLLGGLWAARATGLDRGSGVTAVVPGGLTELTALANERDLRTDVVIAVHLVRRVGVVLFAVVLILPW